MTRHVAFLRAINVGGRNVAMSVLKREFERMGFGDVETFIASGNVLFTTSSRDMAAIERRIEDRLRDVLGYDVATFVRTLGRVAAIARYEPFPRSEMARAAALNVGFLADPISREARVALGKLATPNDRLHASGREVYWLCRQKQSDSKFSNAVLERALKVRATFRGINTVTRLAGKAGAQPGRTGA